MKVELKTFDMAEHQSRALVDAVQAVLQATGEKWVLDYTRQGYGCLGYTGKVKGGKDQKCGSVFPGGHGEEKTCILHKDHGGRHLYADHK